jgi:hypothetical protein
MPLGEGLMVRGTAGGKRLMIRPFFPLLFPAE